jgi:hypothetical protein
MAMVGHAMHARRSFERSGARLRNSQAGKWGYILAWVLGIPIPILLMIYLLRGCT